MLECHSQLITRGHLPNIIFIDGGISLGFLQGALDSVFRTTYTFSAQNLGVASADRRIVVCVRGWADNSTTVSSATIGGVAATIHINQGMNFGSAAIFSAIVPTGATGDIVITWGGVQAGNAISAYAIRGETSATPDFVVNDLSNPLDITPTISGNTAVIGHGGISGNNNLANSVAWTWAGGLGLVENVEQANTYLSNSTANLVTSGSGNVTASYATGNLAPGLQVIGWK